MADILIRGMEMPKDGRKHTALLQFLEDGKCRAIVEYSKSYDDRSVKVFEAVPLPEGHGRLIDGDALDEAFTNLRFNEDGTLAHWDDRRNWCLHGEEIERLIREAPTIVPAEGGNADGN